MHALLFFALLCASANANDSTTLELESGNNLIGFGVLPPDPSIEETLSGVSEDVKFILGEHHYAIQLDEQWIRNFDHFEHTLGYWINLDLSDSTELEILGDRTDPDVLIQLHEGDNLVHFSCKEEVPVSDVIPDWALDQVTAILGDGQSTTKVNGSWVGNLTELHPNSGYWLTVSSDVQDFSFVCPDGDGKSLHVYACIDPFASNYDDYATVDDGSCTYDVPVSWDPSPYKTRTFLFLNDVRIDGTPIDPAADPVCVKQDGECLGFGYTRDGWTGITAYEGDTFAPLSFTVYDSSESLEVNLDVPLPPSFVDGYPEYGGCTDPLSINYTSWATFDIGNCVECDTDQDCGPSESICSPLICQDHACVTEARDCDDGDPCTTDACTELEGCVYEPIDSDTCDGDSTVTEDADAGCGCQLSPATPFGWFAVLPVLLRRRRRAT